MNTLDSLFTWFLTATIRASLLALAVLALQVALRRRLAARWRYALWLPVVLVLVAPQLPESRWSAENYMTVKAAPIAPTPEPTVSATVPAYAGIPNGSALVPKAESTLGWRQLAGLTWLAGSGFLLLAGLFSYARTMRRMWRGEIAAMASVRDGLAEAAAACGLRRAPRLLVSTAVTSPAVTGFLRPVLLLPAGMQTEFSREELHHVLAHECTHLRRHDVAGNWLLCLLQALHWCNPLLWLAFAHIRRDREAACDEQVLARGCGEERASYGHVLLRLAGAPRQPGFAVGWVGIFGPGAAMRSRILAIAGYRPRHAGWGALSLALVCGLIAAGATRAPQALAAVDQAPQIRIESKIYSMQVNPNVPIDVKGDSMGSQGEDATAIQKPEDLKGLLAQFGPERGGRVLAAPTVMTRDGQRAIIETGEEAPAVPGAARRFAGYRLEMTPKVEAGVVTLELVWAMSQAADRDTGKVLPTPIQDWSRVKLEVHKFTTTVTLAKERSFTIYHPGYGGNDPAKQRAAVLVILTPKIVGAADLPNGALPLKPAGDIVGEARLLPDAKAEGPKPANPANAEAARLAAIVIPKLTLRDASLVDALKELSALAKKADPAGKGMTMVLPPRNDARITLQLSDIPVTEALKYITNLASMLYRFDGERILITPIPR